MREILSKNESTGAVQPPIENRGVDPPEVHGMAGIAVLEVGEVRIGAVEAAPDARRTGPGWLGT